MFCTLRKFLSFIIQLPNEIPKLFLRVLAVLIMKNWGKLNGKPHFGMCPLEYEDNDMVIFKFELRAILCKYLYICIGGSARIGIEFSQILLWCILSYTYLQTPKIGCKATSLPWKHIPIIHRTKWSWFWLKNTLFLFKYLFQLDWLW